MKWNCGPTAAERWAASYEWHSWFAWRPVRVGPRDCRWLEMLERRRESGGFYCGPSWKYREPQQRYSSEG